MTSEKVKITILVDNLAGDGLIAEHGLALWIETEGKRILFDTGQGGALETNARVLGVDLGKIDILILSHGHYDHTGGIADVLQRAPKAEIFCHSGAVQPRYAIRNGTVRSIQMPQKSKAAINKLSSKHLYWVQQPMSLFGKVGITGPVPRETSFENPGGPFYLDLEGKRPDLIEDDLAIWIQTDQGIILCVGCCHAGLVNTLHYVRRITKQDKIRAIIGGLHLVNAGHQRLDQTLNALRSFSPDIMVPCHCTGETAVAALRDAFGERVSTGAAGMTYRF
jgi:7,8-dihydropterin-6-yl-methyl-4-(beta-D-ribofuranosyl)aminobenzene 5'-phosphate synthase